MSTKPKHQSKDLVAGLDAAEVATLTVKQLEAKLAEYGVAKIKGKKAALAKQLLEVINQGTENTGTTEVATPEAEQLKEDSQEEERAQSEGEKSEGPTKSALDNPARVQMSAKKNNSSEQAQPSVGLKPKPLLLKLKPLLLTPTVASEPQSETTPVAVVEPETPEPEQETVSEDDTKKPAVEEDSKAKEPIPQEAATESETDEPIPSFCQLLSLFKEWPSQFQDLMSALPPVSAQLEIMKMHHLETTWGLDVYSSLQHADALDNVFVEQFSRGVHKHLDAQRQKLVGFVNPHCFEMGSDHVENAARHVVAAFPNKEMSIEELHNFTLIFPTFRSPSSESSIGHFNLFVVLNMLSLDETCDTTAAWPVLHWESWCTFFVVVATSSSLAWICVCSHISSCCS